MTVNKKACRYQQQGWLLLVVLVLVLLVAAGAALLMSQSQISLRAVHEEHKVLQQRIDQWEPTHE